MTQNANVIKNNNENSTSLLRRFQKRVQSAGVQHAVRKSRYQKRTPSQQVKKKTKLEQLRRGEKIRYLVKLGFLPDKRGR